MRQTGRKGSWADFCNPASESAANPRQHWVFYPGRFSFGLGANLQTRCAPRFAPSAFPPSRTRQRWRPLADAAGCEPQTCKPCFCVGRWRNAALAPPVSEHRQEGPLSLGAYVRAPTL